MDAYTIIFMVMVVAWLTKLVVRYNSFVKDDSFDHVNYLLSINWLIISHVETLLII